MHQFLIFWKLFWFLLTTFLISKCILFHPRPEYFIITLSKFFALVQPTVKSNEFCLYLLQLLALGIHSGNQFCFIFYSNIGDVHHSFPPSFRCHVSTKFYWCVLSYTAQCHPYCFRRHNGIRI